METRRPDYSQSDGTVLIISTAPSSDKAAQATATGSSSHHSDPVSVVEELKPAEHTAGVYQNVVAVGLAAGTSGSQLPHMSTSDLQELSQIDDFLSALETDAAAQQDAAAVETAAGTSGSQLQHMSTSDLPGFSQNDGFPTELDTAASEQQDAAAVEAAASTSQLLHMSTSDLQEYCRNANFLPALDSDAAAQREAAVVGSSNHSGELVIDDAETAMRSIANEASTSDEGVPHGMAAFGSSYNASSQYSLAAPTDISIDTRGQELAGHLPGATPESGQTYFDGDTAMQTYIPDTDSNIASSSIAPAGFDASPGTKLHEEPSEVELFYENTNQMMRELLNALGEHGAASEDPAQIVANGGMLLSGEQPMTSDKDGAYMRPPLILAEVLKALLTLRQRLASQLLTLSIDIAPPHASTYVRELRQVMRQGLVRNLPVRRMLEDKFQEGLRENALKIFYKLHVDHPFVTHDSERQSALAAYTGQDRKQVLQAFTNYRSRPARQKDKDQVRDAYNQSLGNSGGLLLHNHENHFASMEDEQQDTAFLLDSAFMQSYPS